MFVSTGGHRRAEPRLPAARSDATSRVHSGRRRSPATLVGRCEPRAIDTGTFRVPDLVRGRRHGRRRGRPEPRSTEAPPDPRSPDMEDRAAPLGWGTTRPPIVRPVVARRSSVPATTRPRGCLRGAVLRGAGLDGCELEV